MKRLALIGVLLTLSACSGGNATSRAVDSAATAPLTVVTTAFPLLEAATKVGGGRVKAVNVLGDSALADEPLSDDQRRQLLDADLVISLGQATQPGVEQALIERSGPTLAVLDHVAIKQTPGASANGVDPYVWMDPSNQGRITELVREQLTALDGEGTASFVTRSGQYRTRLAQIDSDFSHALSGCTRRELVTTKPAFAYLASRYGLNQLVVDIPGVKSSGIPGPVALTDVRQADEPTTVFAPELPPSRLARELFTDDNVRVSVLDSLENRTEQARRGGANYESVMALNLDALEGALGCAEAFGGK